MGPLCDHKNPIIILYFGVSESDYSNDHADSLLWYVLSDSIKLIFTYIVSYNQNFCRHFPETQGQTPGKPQWQRKTPLNRKKPWAERCWHGWWLMGKGGEVGTNRKRRESTHISYMEIHWLYWAVTTRAMYERNPTEWIFTFPKYCNYLVTPSYQIFIVL